MRICVRPARTGEARIGPIWLRWLPLEARYIVPGQRVGSCEVSAQTVSVRSAGPVRAAKACEPVVRVVSVIWSSRSYGGSGFPPIHRSPGTVWVGTRERPVRHRFLPGGPSSPSPNPPNSATDRNPHPPGLLCSLCARRRNPRSGCAFINMSKRDRSVGGKTPTGALSCTTSLKPENVT